MELIITQAAEALTSYKRQLEDDRESLLVTVLAEIVHRGPVADTNIRARGQLRREAVQYPSIPSWHVFDTFRHTLSVLQDLQRQLQAAALEGELWQEEARQALLREREEVQLQADRKLGVHQMGVWDPAAACVAGRQKFPAVVLVHK